MNNKPFGFIFKKPSRYVAHKLDEICKEEGGYGFLEFESTELCPLLSFNKEFSYQGWFSCPKNENTSYIQHRVSMRVEAECHIHLVAY